ncbi:MULTISPECIES: hypothetical protein [Flavobacterium]|uniref:hypothetical protein n=1 Tax=Flavobacterium TaxID=237 RepID=UPI001FCBAF58|nr:MULTISPECIES: hypothetical protein [Flavobacterium]UOK41626.1 hypothetical protein LZF87_09915 [Flavobacterium enshiense]
MITLEKLEIYDKYAGDEDHLARVGSEKELELFRQNLDWYEINNFKQDIYLISQHLVSEKYKETAIKRIKTLCDNQTFDILTQSIQ